MISIKFFGKFLLNSKSGSVNINLNDIVKHYESYTIVYMMVRTIMQEAKILTHQERAREITNYLLTDELHKKSEKPSKSAYDDED